MNELIQISQLSKTFFDLKSETKVLDSIDFNVYPEQIVTILGPSGCGKSTLLNLVSGIELPTSGTITVNAKLGYMFQKDALLPWKNVLENVLFSLSIKKKKTEDDYKYALFLLEKYGLSQFKSSYPNELSGGMKQRVSLIRTLCLKPDLLLLDEPFSALDAQTKLMVQEDVYKIIKKEHLSCLLVTHDISEAIALSDKVIILSKRPCKIEKIIDIEFNELDPHIRRKQKEFPIYFNKIFELINQ